MPDFSFVVVAVIAFLAPVIRELIPRLFVPAIVLELVLGIIVGPQVLDIAHSSDPVELFSTIGLAALLFLAGREIDVERLRGPVLERALACFGLGFLIAAAIAGPLHEIGLIKTPLLVAVILVATSLSVIIVPLRDEGEVNTSFGQQVIATAAIAEFASVILLSFFYSNERPGFGTELVHLCAFGAARGDRVPDRLPGGSDPAAQAPRWTGCGSPAPRSRPAPTSPWSRSSSGSPASSGWRPSSPPSPSG